MLVQADTDAASAKLTKFDKQLAATDDVARKGIEARLGATYSPEAFAKYDAALSNAARKAQDRAAFKAELGANFNSAAFNAYERAVEKARAAGNITATVQVKTDAAIARLNELQVKMGKVPDKISTDVEVDDAVASAKLDLLNRKIRDTETSLARMRLGGGFLGGGGGGGGGGFFGGLGNPLSGVPPALAAAPAILPLAAGGLGAATSVLGSAAAGALGAGALGAAGLGTGAAGLGPILALSGGLKDATALATKLEAADQKLTAAQTLFGDSSKQAAAAQLAINKLIAGADPAVVKFAQTWSKLTDVIDTASQSVLPAFAKTLAPIVTAITQLMPTIVQMAKIDLSGISKGLAPLLALVRSADFKSSLLELSRTFAKLAVPLGQAATNLLTAFLHVAVAAAPFLVQIADAFERWTKSFSNSLTPGQHLNDLIRGLVGQLHSWFDLAMSIGKLMVTVFSSSAGSGQQLVNQLTALLTKWNAWLNTTAGQAGMKKFFTDSANLLRGVVATLGPVVALISSLAIGLIPTMTTLLAPLAKILAAISKWVNGLSKDLPPVLNALPGLAVAVGVLASWQALKALTSSIASDISGVAGGKVGIGKAVAPGGSVGVGGAAAAGEKGIGVGTKILGGLGIAALGTVISTEIGDSIKGGVGRAVKDIGSGASIGGGLGSMFGPWGIAVGAAVGGGLGAAIDLFTKHGKSDGAKWAAQFTATLPNKVSDAVQQGLKTGQDKAPELQPTTPTRPGAPGAPARGTPQSQTAPALAFDAEARKQLAKFVIWAGQQGAAAGNAWASSLSKAKFPSTFIAIRDAEQSLAEVPKKVREGGRAAIVAWRDQAAAQMIAYAQGLEKNGKLPKGAVDAMIASLENQFPQLITYLNLQGLNSDRAVARGLQLTQARGALRTALGNIRTQWNDTYIQAKITNENINKNTKQAEDDLNNIIATSTGKRRTQAVAALHHLESLTKDSYSRMTDQVSSSMAAMTHSIETGSAKAAAAADANYKKLAASVFNAMNAGVLTTSQGSKLIGDALNATLAAFGAKPINIVGLTSKQLQNFTPQTYLGGAGTGSLHQGGLATGGLFQVGHAGQAGHDTVPMSVGGRDIVVGGGEQVAVFNRHQLPIVNKALAREGYAGLPGLFSKVNRPHYMASGGFVPGFAVGGTLSYGQLEGLWDRAGGPPGVASIAAAIALAESGGRDVMQQGQPFATTGWGYWQITPGGPQYLDPMTNALAAVAKYRGAGNTFQPWTTFNDGAYRAFLQGGVPAMGGAGISKIVAPGVKGSGTIADIARKALGLEATAANAFLARLAPTAGAGGAGATSGGKTGAYGALSLGRTDQGVDFGGAGPVGAVAAGRVLRNTIWPGWPGTGGLVYSTAKGNVYIMEDFAPSVAVGQTLKAGQIVGHATGGSSGIETGWANASGTGPLTPYNGAPDGTPMPGGIAFRKFLGLANGGVFGRKGGGPFAAGQTALGNLSGLGGASAAAAGAPALPSAAGIIGLPALPKLPGSVPNTIQGARGVARTIFGTRAGIAKAEQSYGEIDTFYSQQDSGLAFVDPNTGLLNPDAIAQRLAHLSTLIQYRQRIFDMWSMVVALTERLLRANEKIVAKLRRKYAQAKASAAKLHRALAGLSTHGLKGQALKAMQTHIATMKHTVQDADKQLGGMPGEISKIVGNLASARGDLTSATGDRGSAWLALLAEKGEYASVAGTVASPALASATSAAGAVAASDQTSALLTQLLTTSQQTLAVSQAQYKVLQPGGSLKAIDFGGSFAQGGIVPGPAGAPRVIIAHGGEAVSPVGASSAIHLHFAPGTEWLRDFVDVRVEQTTRGQARRGVRSLPGSR